MPVGRVWHPIPNEIGLNIFCSTNGSQIQFPFHCDLNKNTSFRTELLNCSLNCNYFSSQNTKFNLNCNGSSHCFDENNKDIYNFDHQNSSDLFIWKQNSSLMKEIHFGTDSLSSVDYFSEGPLCPKVFQVRSYISLFSKFLHFVKFTG